MHCIAGNRKNGFLIVFPSHKIVVLKNLVLLETLRGPAGKCETPPHMADHPICGESYIQYTEYWGLIPQYTVLLLLSLVTHWFSSHHHLHHQQLHLSSYFLPWERVSWDFLGYHNANFLTRSFGFLELFSYSPLSVFGHRWQGSASCLVITRTIWSE